jgi:hypothetical protein
MSTEIPPAGSEPKPPPPPKGDGTIDPDNWHIDGAGEVAPDGLLTGKPAPKTAKAGEITPANWHIDSEPTA